LHSPIAIWQRTRLKTFWHRLVLPITKANFGSSLLCFLLRSLRTSFPPFVTLIFQFQFNVDLVTFRDHGSLGIGMCLRDSRICGFHCHNFHRTKYASRSVKIILFYNQAIRFVMRQTNNVDYSLAKVPSQFCFDFEFYLICFEWNVIIFVQ